MEKWILSPQRAGKTLSLPLATRFDQLSTIPHSLVSLVDNHRACACIQLLVSLYVFTLFLESESLPQNIHTSITVVIGSSAMIHDTIASIAIYSSEYYQIIHCVNTGKHPSYSK